MSSMRAGERTYLTRAQLSDIHGADVADIAAVEKFASDYGLSVTAVGPAQRAVRVIGTLDNLAKAFNVQFGVYQSAQGAYRGYTGSAQVPADISDIVQGVFGLDNKPQVTFHLRKLQPASVRGNVSPAAQGQSYDPTEVASLYNFPQNVDGTGQCIGILEFGGGYRPSDLDTYFQSLGVPTPNIVPVSVNGAFNRPIPGQNSPDYEVMLDIEVAGAIAPGALVAVYFAPNTSFGYISAVAKAIFDSANNPSVISTSWGGPEPTWQAAALQYLDQLFQIAAAMGITICAAAGDQGYTDGYYDPTNPSARAYVDFPASSPNVLACGGTRLVSGGPKGQVETVWNDSPSSATGGGISQVFTAPDWQAKASVPPSVNPGGVKGRGLPDVSGDADPVTGYNCLVHGQPVVIGGTSAVAPLWAALLTLVNQELGTSVGFVNPVLYEQGLSAGAFNDVVSGNNGKGGYSAGPGWDACSGLGSPVGDTVAQIL